MRFYKIRFHSALHVDSKGSGEAEIADEHVKSDTLSGALCLAFQAIFPDVSNEFFLRPPFRVSSVFPYVGGVFLFPCPAWRIWENMQVEQRKKTKKVRWVSQGILERVLSGGTVLFDDVKVLECGIAVTREEYRTNLEISSSEAWMVSERQRVSVDRLNAPEGGNTFFFALQFFSEFSGLYFLADADEEAALKRLEKALAFLGDSGIGADRNCGLGHFSVTASDEFHIKTPESAEGAFTLSLFNPGVADDLIRLTDTAAYSLETRTGWISGSTLGRPPIRVFAEGAYFSAMPTGRVVEMFDVETRKALNLKISHSAPRDFRAFTVPCKRPPYLAKEAL